MFCFKRKGNQKIERKRMYISPSLTLGLGPKFFPPPPCGLLSFRLLLFFLPWRPRSSPSPLPNQPSSWAPAPSPHPFRWQVGPALLSRRQVGSTCRDLLPPRGRTGLLQEIESATRDPRARCVPHVGSSLYSSHDPDASLSLTLEQAVALV